MIANSYDGNLFFITDVVYDSLKNILYLAPVQTTYSFLMALRGRAFPAGSDIYKRNYYPFGEWAPLITKDNHSFVLKRFDGLFAVTGGSFEASEGRHSKPFESKGSLDLPARTAAIESIEELLGVAGEPLTARCDITQFHGLQSLTLSHRTIFPEGGAVGFVEFIYPLHLSARKDEIIELIENNRADHNWEHPNKLEDKQPYVIASIDFDSVDPASEKEGTHQTELFARMFNPKTSQTNPNSNSLVHPIMLSAVLAASRKFVVPRKLPHAHVIIVSLGAVATSTTKISQQISSTPQEKRLRATLTFFQKQAKDIPTQQTAQPVLTAPLSRPPSPSS